MSFAIGKFRERLFVTSLLVLAISTARDRSNDCRADDAAEMQFLGFSADGKHLAFEVFTIGSSGLNSPGSSFVFVDVAKNKYAAPSINVGFQKEGADEANRQLAPIRAEARKKAQPVWEKLGIKPGNQGFHAYSRLPGDFTATPELLLTREPVPPWRFRQGCPKFAISMSTREIPSPINWDDKPQLLTIRLRQIAVGDQDIVQTLQEDKQLPATRTHPVAYRFTDVYFFQKSLAVFVQFESPGFEGNDSSFMVVTGTLQETP